MRQAGIGQKPLGDRLILEPAFPGCGSGESGVLRIMRAAQRPRASERAEKLSLLRRMAALAKINGAILDVEAPV